MKAIKLLLLSALLFASTGSVRAWDATGHMLVVRIAVDRLPPEVRKAAEADLAKFNGRMRTEFDLVTAACWMDDVRSQTQLYSTWHYLDLPLHGGEKSDPKSFAAPNGYWLATNCLATLSGEPPFSQAHDGQPIDRPLALIMLFHIEGDLHQPLHTTGNDDRGGNDIIVFNLREAAKSRNLHHLWDSGYRRLMQGTRVDFLYEPPYQQRISWGKLHALAEPWVAEQAAAWSQKYAPAPGWEVGTPETWLREGNDLCRKMAYGKLPGGLDVKEAIIPAEYVAEMEDVTRHRIVLAGFRLAEILKKVYANGAPAAAGTPTTSAAPSPTAPVTSSTPPIPASATTVTIPPGAATPGATPVAPRAPIVPATPVAPRAPIVPATPGALTSPVAPAVPRTPVPAAPIPRAGK